MDLAKKFKETVTSVLPIVAIVLVLNFTVAPIGAQMTGMFLAGSVLLIIGLSIFLLGVDLGILPIGSEAGSALVKKRNLILLLIAAFVIGFVITAAEPDVQVLADQVRGVNPSVDKTQLVFMIAAGVGFFVTMGLLRTVLSLPLNLVLAISYAVVFVLAFLTKPEFLAVAFDSGGATTGPMTVPFIMALGVGVALVRGRENDSFGLTGVASVGPIAAVLLLGIFSKNAERSNVTTEVATKSVYGFEYFLHLLPEIIVEVTKALVPLLVLFLILQITLVKMPPRRLAKMLKGLVYSFVGLVIFLLGVKGGFMPAGEQVGKMLGTLATSTTSVDGYTVLLIVVGIILGAVVVCAEPAVWVLTDQVEEVSGGTIKRKLLLLALSFGVALSIGLAMVRVLAGFSIWWYLIPCYLFAIVMTFFCPKMFVAIAFDSGGVASGPMTSTFILSFTLGAATACGGDPITDAFGVIALVAMTPLITIQILGLIFNKKVKDKGVQK